MEIPKVRQAMEEIRTGGPAAMTKYAGDPEFLQVKVLESQLYSDPFTKDSYSSAAYSFDMEG